MKTIKVLSAAFLLFEAVSASAYAYDYLMADRLTSWNLPFSAATTKIATLTNGDWDDGYYDMALGANYRFYFYGKLVTHLRIWTNGYVTFGFGSAPSDYSDFSADPLPNTDNPNGYAAPWWDDWDLAQGGELYYEQFNTAGYYYTKIEWRSVMHVTGSGTATFEVYLCSHTHTNLPDVIIFLYNDVVVGNASYDYGANGTVGVEHPAGTQGRKYLYGEANLSTSDKIYFVPFVHIYGGTQAQAGSGNTPEIILWRPDGGNWFNRDASGTAYAPYQWGTRGDVPLPGDYDGDGDSDEVVLRPTTYHWFGNSPGFTLQFGANGDIPVPADFDGNGTIDLAVFRPNPGTWFVYHRDTGTSEVINWGTQGDIPLPADYDNDGKADCAVFRPSTNTWFIRKSSNPAQAWVMTFGTDGDVPMPTNFQSTLFQTISVFRPSDGNWYAYNQSTGAWSVPFNWGQNGDVAVPGDENAGGATDAAVFRPQNGRWFIRNAASFPVVVTYGTIGDIPMFRRNFLTVGPSSGNPDR